MNLEYRMGYCNSCKADHKLQRQKPNHIIHFLITVTLGIFTNGIGSIVWLGIWYLISVKFSDWSCHTCRSKDVDPTHHIEHTMKSDEPSTIDRLKHSYKKIVGLILSCVVIIFIYSFVGDGDEGTSSKKTKENIVNARVDVKDTSKKKPIIQSNNIESGLCYLYDIKYDENSVSGLVSCKEGKLNLDFYDSESKEVIETKTVTFKDNKFYIEVENLEKKHFKFSIKLTKKQISEQQKKKNLSMPSVKSYDSQDNSDESNNIAIKCTLKNWKYSKYSSEYLVIDGKTTCSSGKIILQVYDENNNFLGEESDSIESGIFNIFLKTTANPISIDLKYTIAEK